MTRGILIIGGGIVGSALAAYLGVGEGLSVTVLERGPRGRLVGSTGHAPGFVGLLNEAPVATDLAQASAAAYAQLSRDGRAGFDRIGGLEVATTALGMQALEDRAALAKHAGLPAHVLDPKEAAAAAPHLVHADCAGGVLYPSDGTARADLITAGFRERAERGGARFSYDADVTAIDIRAARVVAARTAADTYPADDIVVACGIWGPGVLSLVGQRLPLTPVAHPYVYGPDHRRALPSAPFVRWPEHHVYARDHGDRFGLGCYGHAPLAVSSEDLGDGAEQPWPAALFDPAITEALALLPGENRFTPLRRLNGVFSMTPDNLPLVGALEDITGLWAAEALWVTHAAGAAQALARQMIGNAAQIEGMEALRPDRFAAQPTDALTARSLALYSDIYAATTPTRQR